MNSINIRRFLLFVVVFSMTTGACNAQIFQKNTSRKVEKQLFGKTSNKKREIKIREPRSVTKAKRKQEANEKRLKREYAKSVKRSQKRAYQIQTPEVQARMKQDQKIRNSRDKAKKKKIKTGSKKAGKKYGK